MAHLNFFGVENFKVFADLHRFDLKPITILTGTNSSGKSSLTKAILLLKEGFEKVKFDSFLQSINAWSINNILFQNNLNLGNFDNCKNINSDSDIMIFELPFRFPLIEDQYILKLSYQKTKNAVKNGSLINIAVTNPASDLVILTHSNITGKMKIDFSFLKNKFDSIISKIRKIHTIEDQISALQKPYLRNLDRLKLDDEIVNDDIETPATTLDGAEIPDEVQIQINNLLSQQRSILSTYSIYNDNMDEDAFESIRGMYNLNLYRPHDMYNELRPLLNYLFIFDIDKVEANLDHFGFKVEEFEEVKKRSQDVKDMFDENISNLTNHLNDLELSVLDKIVFNENKFQSYEELNFFSNTVSSLNSTYLITDMLARGVFEIEPAFNSEILSTGYKKSKLLLKPVQDLLNDNLGYFTKEFLYGGIGSMMNTLSSVYKSISYVPSVRSKVDRVFRNNTDSYLQEVLYQLHEAELNDDSKRFIDKYLKIFKIADTIEIMLSEDSSFTKIYFVKGKTKHELADVGYGISQILPVLLKIALKITELAPLPEYGKYYSESSIIIVEEPETNLHPALQSKLADMFVECYNKFNIQFIVETHSEYLIRKLQYLTAKNKFAKEDSVIYYFNKPDDIPAGEQQVKRIDILEDGSLSDDFGTGFFDEAANWELELLRLKNNKARQN